MRKKQCVIVIAGMLALVGSAQASIGWTQGFTVGALNQVEWLGGVGSVAAVNKAAFVQKQHFSNSYMNLGGFQRQSGTIFQNAAASGPVGPSNSRQEASLQGDQSLGTVNGMFPGVRAQQSLGGTMTNLVVKPEGIGQVDGNQRFVGGQHQGYSTPYGSATQSQRAEILQRGSITTTADTDPTVTNKVNLQLNQSQMTGGL